MLVPLTTHDFLARGATVYAERVAVIDEPDQPGRTLGELTFAELHGRARAVGAGLDALGVRSGERIAVVSPNATRMLDLFYGATATGRVVVPINFRLGQEAHSRAAHTPRTSTRSNRSARSRARGAPWTRRTPRSSGNRSRWASTAG